MEIPLFKILFLIGRILFGVYFIFNGVNHLKMHKMMSGFAKLKGVPMAPAAVAVSGIMIILGGLSILLGVCPVVGIILLIAFLIPTTLMMHNFWKTPDMMMKIGEMVNFTKNMALIGALLMFLIIPRPWPLSLGC